VATPKNAISRADNIGKVFVAVGQDMRKGLSCEGVFSCQAASAYVNVSRYPTTPDVRLVSSVADERNSLA
jgi:hypothetical protein